MDILWTHLDIIINADSWFKNHYLPPNKKGKGVRSPGVFFLLVLAIYISLSQKYISDFWSWFLYFLCYNKNTRRYSSSVEHQLPKLGRGVRFPLSALNLDFTRKTGCLLSRKTAQFLFLTYVICSTVVILIPFFSNFHNSIFYCLKPLFSGILEAFVSYLSLTLSVQGYIVFLISFH